MLVGQELEWRGDDLFPTAMPLSRGDIPLPDQAPGDGFVLVFRAGNDPPETIVCLKANGELEYGPNYTPDGAARLFWESLRDQNPYKRALLQALFKMHALSHLLAKLASLDGDSFTDAQLAFHARAAIKEAQATLAHYGIPYTPDQHRGSVDKRPETR